MIGVLFAAAMLAHAVPGGHVRLGVSLRRRSCKGSVSSAAVVISERPEQSEGSADRPLSIAATDRPVMLCACRDPLHPLQSNWTAVCSPVQGPQGRIN